MVVLPLNFSMPEIKKRLEQKIVDYLDTLAKNSKVTELTTTKPYATIEELAVILKSTRSQIGNQVTDLLSRNRIREFPLSKGSKKLYGSIILPTVTKDVSASDAKGSSYRIYGREITINLAIPFK